MNKKNKIVILSVLIFIFIIISIFIYVDLFLENSSGILLIGDKKEDIGVIEGSNNGKDNTEDIDTDEYVEEETDSNKGEILEESTSENTNYTEEDIVSYFENMENEVESSGTFKEKFKEYFITTIDFIFYGKEINRYTFNELSGTAKAKIISVALKIDSKIEKCVPGYKETISSTSGKIYTDIKEKLVTLYMDISTDICNNNEEDCNKVKEIFSEIKDVCSIGWEYIKNLVSGGVTKVREWYEIYSGK